MKSKLLIISPLFVIIGLISIILTHSALNPTPPPVETTPTITQTSTIYVTTSTPFPSPVTYITPTPAPITPFPEQFAAEVSAVSRGVRFDVAVNDTNPQLGGAVVIVISITNMNSSEPVCIGGGTVELEVHNSEGKEVYGHYIWFPRTTLACVELPLHKTWGPDLLVWKVELDPSFNVEVKPGESYDIEVSFRFPERSTVTTPIRVVVGS